MVDQFEGDAKRVESGTNSARGVENITEGNHLEAGDGFSFPVVGKIAEERRTKSRGRPIGSLATKIGFSSEAPFVMASSS